MKITVKMLQGGECNLKVSSTTTIAEIKTKVASKLKIPVKQQKLLLAGRTLSDEKLVESYPNITDGTKLNLVVVKPEGLVEVSAKYFQEKGMSPTEAMAAAIKFKQDIEYKFNQLSWDDFDRLAYDCLLEEEGGPPPGLEPPFDPDELYGM